MKNRMQTLLLMAITTGSLLFMVSCDTVTEPYYSAGDTGPVDTSSVQKVVLLEDFTGIGCNNCPAASEVAADIADTYPDQVVTVAIHAGHFADPRQIDPGGVDYRTEVGTQLYNDFGFSSLPNGMVDRVEHAGSQVTSVSAWFENVASQLELDAVADVQVSSTYEESSRTADVTVGIEALSVLPATAQISVWLLESGMISPQKDNRQPGGKVDDYVHKHMFRASFNGAYGDVLSATGMAEGESVEVDFDLVLDEKFVAENCSIVAFVHVYDELTGERTVLQAAEIHLGD